MALKYATDWEWPVCIIIAVVWMFMSGDLPTK